MKYRLLLLLLITISSLMLSSCATIWDIQGLQTQINTIKASITSISIETTNNKNNINTLNTNIQNLRGNYEFLKNTVDSLVNIQPSQSNFDDKIKTLQEDLNAKIAQNDKHYIDLQVKLYNLNSSVSLMQLQLKDALESIGEIKTTQDTFSKALSTVDDTLSNIKGNDYIIDSLSSKINDLSYELAKIEKSINDFSTTDVSSGTIKTSDFVMLAAKVDALKDKLSLLNTLQTDLNSLKQKESVLEANISRMQISKNSLNIPYTYIIVQKGDTLYQIANAYNTTINFIEKLNNKSNADIYGDEMLKLPLKNNCSFPFNSAIKLNIPYGAFVDHSLASWVEFNYTGNVVSILPGRIDEIGNNVVFGNYVKLYCGNYIYITYGNLTKINVKEGDWIKQNYVIGYAKNFKLSIMINGDIKDPLKVLAVSKDIGTVTYYTEWDDGKNPTYPSFRITRMGTLAKDWQTIAADLTKIPLGSIVYIPYFANMANKGIFRVEDSGSAVNGNDIDIFISDIQKALKFKKNLEVYIIKKAK